VVVADDVDEAVTELIETTTAVSHDQEVTP